MEFDLSVSQVNELLANIGKETELARRLSSHALTNGRILVPDHIFDEESMKQLWRMAEKMDDKSLYFQLIAARNVEEEKYNTPVVSNIDWLIPALKTYLSANAIDGWLYRRNRDGVLLPWLIESIEYVPREEGMPGLPYVSIQLLANTIAATSHVDDAAPDQWRTGMTNAILFYQRDMGKLSIPELLARKGYYKECPEFKEEYERHKRDFSNYQPFYGKQFLARNSGFLITEGETRLQKNLEYFRISAGTSVKCVNDEEIIERRIETHSNRKAIVEETSGQIPIHCYIHMFHLDLHQNCWIHVQNLEEYQYRPELKNKLILPQEHRKLIDILTAHSDILMDDIIEGKSGGTTILCMGAAGLRCV